MTPRRSRFLMLAIMFLFLSQPGMSASQTGPGLLAPGFKTVTTSGTALSLEDFRGHVLVLSFFATWCDQCRQSVPRLVEMNRKYSKQGLQILGMSVDEAGDPALKDFIEELHVNYPVGLAGESTQAGFGIRTVPVVFVIDKKGKVSGRFMGFNDEIGRSTEGLVKKLLAEK